MTQFHGNTTYLLFALEFLEIQEFLKLRHYLPLKQLRQLYYNQERILSCYNLIYPYLSYAVLAWGSACASHLTKIQVKQNHIIRLMFFATLYGENKDSALPLPNLLDLLTVKNVFSLRLLQFSNQWHKKQLPTISDNHFRYASDVHTYNTRYASKANFYKARFRTNIGKTTFSALAVDHWQKLPQDLKDQSISNFPRKAKQYPATIEANIKSLPVKFLQFTYFNNNCMSSACVVCERVC